MSTTEIADPSTLPADAVATRKPTVALALGSGGAKGLAHIGAIEEIEAHGYQIVAIAGTSMGALIGGVYAMGKLGIYRDWVCSLAKMDVLKLVDWTLSGGGLIKGERIIETMRGLIGDAAIEDLPLAYTAVATDLDREREVWLTRGSLFDAIRASIAIPTVFRPQVLSERRLIDGGLLNPVPVTPLIREPADYLFAVSMDGPPDAGAPDEVAATPTADNDSYRSRIGGFIGKLMPHGTDKPREPGMLELLMQSMDLMQANLSRLRLAAYEPDLLIRMPRNVATVYEFYRATELIELGRKQAREALANWRPAHAGQFTGRP
jgi:NTE family protein|nr:patatin-like phospholipase family protein [Dyella sp. ASV24]